MENTEQIRAAGIELLEALVNLNRAIDAYWNDVRRPDRLVKEINRHQQLSLKAIQKADGLLKPVGNDLQNPIQLPKSIISDGIEVKVTYTPLSDDFKGM